MEDVTLKEVVTLGQGTEPIQGGSTGNKAAREYTLWSNPLLSLQISCHGSPLAKAIKGSNYKRVEGAEGKYPAQEPSGKSWGLRKVSV